MFFFCFFCVRVPLGLLSAFGVEASPTKTIVVLSFLSFDYIFFLSSCAFLTIASLEWGSVTGRSEYGASLLRSNRVHSFKKPSLGRLPLNRTSRDHFPLGYSAQVWVVINGHFVKPSLESSSLGLVLKIMDLVPIGDLENNSKSPLRVEFTVMRI